MRELTLRVRVAAYVLRRPAQGPVDEDTDVPEAWDHRVTGAGRERSSIGPRPMCGFGSNPGNLARYSYLLTPRARIVTSASAGVQPHLMGLGPVPATEKAPARAGWQAGDVDAVELNEAFEKVARGELGRKTGTGFHTWP